MLSDFIDSVENNEDYKINIFTTLPVMAKFSLTGFFFANEISAVTMVTPALGPSLGVAPSGT